jgi:hypothetical protein
MNSLLRLCDRLDDVWGRSVGGDRRGRRGQYQRRQGYMVQFGRARCLFFSADPAANVVGATADLLLEGDEAQDIAEGKWYKDFAPMAASANATTVVYGTAWTSDTLLARMVQSLRQLEARDGVRRVFAYDADQVAAHVPAYGRYVAAQVARLGRDHPLIRTQYYLETVDAQGGLFPPARRAIMRGDHARRHEPVPGQRYALLIDVGGEEQAGGPGPLAGAAHRGGAWHLENTRRDATALTVVAVEARAGDLPLYRVVDRRVWLGVKHVVLHEQIVALVAHWRAAWVVVDATGVGAGLASFLSAALEGGRPCQGRPCRVIRVVFSAWSKSTLGWDFVGAVETGRYKEYVTSHQGWGSDGDTASGEPETRQFWYEVAHCQYEVLPGPGELMRWGVWESPSYDGLIARGHDDLLVSAALCTVLDNQDWTGTGRAEVVQRADPLDEIDSGQW